MIAETIGDTATGSNNVTGVVADRASINTANGVIDGSDHVTITVIRNSAAVDTSAVTLNATNPSGKTYTLTAHASAQFTAPSYTSSTASARIVIPSGGGDALTITGSGWIVERLYVSSYAAGTQGIVISGVSARVRRTIVKSGTAAIRCTGSGTKTLTNIACFYPGNSGAFTVYHDGGTTDAYHVTARGRSGGLTYYNGGGLTVKACIGIGGGGGGGTSDFYGGGGSDNENVSYDASAPGATNWRNQTGNVLVDYGDGTEDFALHADAQGDYGVTDRSGTEADLATDIRGETRTGTLDAGCWQTSSGGGGGSSIKTINGLAIASVKTFNGLAIASMKTLNGLA